jgi:hypothetical protein
MSQRPNLIEQLAQGALGYRSPLTRWLKQNFEVVTTAKREGMLVWAALAKELEKEGVVDSRGRPPTPAAIRQAWRRLAQQSAGRHELPLPRPTTAGAGGARLKQSIDMRPAVPRSEPSQSDEAESPAVHSRRPRPIQPIE